MKFKFVPFVIGCFSLAFTGCTSDEITSTVESEALEEIEIREEVLVDGSAVTFAAAEIMAKNFMKDNPDVRITVGISNPKTGLKRFCLGDVDMSTSTRPIDPAEMNLCQTNKVEFIELPFVFEVLVLAVHPKNDWASCLTTEELQRIWSHPKHLKDNIETEEEVQELEQANRWDQVRDDFPRRDLILYGMDNDFGPYDYFTSVVTGKTGESRDDYTIIRDEFEMLETLESQSNSLGFLRLASYEIYTKQALEEQEETNQEQKQEFVKLVEVDNGIGSCVEPTSDMIANGFYSPLARPLFIYISKRSLEQQPAVNDFSQYLFDSSAHDSILEVGYIPLSGTVLQQSKNRLTKLKTGSIFTGESSIGINLVEQLGQTN